MIIEEEKVEIVEDENMSSTKEKNKKTKKKKNESKNSDGNVAIKDKVDEQNDLKNNDENPNNENKSANQILENTVDTADIPSSENKPVESNANLDTTTETKKTFSEEPLNKEDTNAPDEEYKSNKSQGVLSIFFIVLSVFLVLVLIAFGALTLYNYKNKNVIAKGVSINSIDLSYCTKDEAKEGADKAVDDAAKKAEDTAK